MMNGALTVKLVSRRIVGALLVVGCLAGCASAPPEAPQPPPVPANALKVGVSSNAPPLIYRVGDKPTGLEYDLAIAFAAYLNRPLQVVEVKWQDQIPALLEGRTDIIMSGMTITPKRALMIDFADPYLQSGQVALVRAGDRERYARGYSDIAGRYQTIGYIKGTFGQEFVEREFPNSGTMAFSTSQSATDALNRGIIAVLVHDGPIVCMLAASNEAKGLVPIFPPLSREYLAWGIRKDDPELRLAANQFISELRREGRLESIVRQWIPYKECTQ
jgi:polar amino acid transport system substrate-binding protein